MKVLSLIVSLCFVFIFVSCKKDRITNEEYSSMDEFYNNNKEQEQTFEITDESSNEPIVGKKGTELYGNHDMFVKPDSSEIDLPYTVGLIELYSYKDYILYQFPSLSGTDLLKTAGMIRVKAYKDGEELVLKNGRTYLARLSSVVEDQAMSVYQGDMPNDVYGAWNLATDGSTVSVDSTNKYLMALNQMGWQNCGKSLGANSTTSVSLKIENVLGSENIELFIVGVDDKALIQGDNLVIPNVPIGFKGKLIAFAINQDKKYVYFEKEVEVTDGLSETINFSEMDEQGLLSKLDAL